MNNLAKNLLSIFFIFSSFILITQTAWARKPAVEPFTYGDIPNSKENAPFASSANSFNFETKIPSSSSNETPLASISYLFLGLFIFALPIIGLAGVKLKGLLNDSKNTTSISSNNEQNDSSNVFLLKDAKKKSKKEKSNESDDDNKHYKKVS